MADILLKRGSTHAATYVPNTFIDEYMTRADGEFVKVYLYLLRCMNSPGMACSICDIADKFDYTDTADSAYVKVFSRNGFRVIYGHIQTGQDFFQTDTPDCDYIISNPPYSLKNEVLERLYAIGKPFAMLINFQGIFDSQKRFQMFKERRVEMLWLSPRVAYMTEGRQPRQGVPFQSGYLCSGICENQLEFEYLDRQEKE